MPNGGPSLLRDHIPLSLRERHALRHMAPGGPRAWFTFPRGVGAKTLAGIEARGWATRQLGITRGGFSFAITPEGKRLFDADAHFRRLASVPPDLNDGSMPILKALAGERGAKG